MKILHNFVMNTDKSLKKKISKKIGNAIKFYRTKINMSQEKLAFNTGIDRTYITALETGVKCASVYCLYLISKELKISLKDLFDFEV